MSHASMVDDRPAGWLRSVARKCKGQANLGAPASVGARLQVGAPGVGRMKRLAMLPGPWQGLFGHAMRLIDDIGAHHIRDPVWTAGGVSPGRGA